ncbi:hypothetical protein NDK43_13075 [Neobacillus pocheonensis]|jgi:hypothetical protein|uniref:Uncharacterized protein n=1 Tax=Neobacillus pocheonensis TaxID=363869 RepID=A0ABT0WA02_9BACI|nr:hypothetical protein [Neobacillus pocheonensis]
MVVTFYFIISWMMIGLLTFNRKRSWGSLREIFFLILFTCLINTHTYLGLFETFKWIKTTTNPKLYVAFLLFRSVFIPVFMTYFTLLIFNQSLKRMLYLVLLFSGIILALDKIGLSSNMYAFKKWNLFYTFSYYIALLFLALFALRWFRGLKTMSGGVNGR